MNKIYSLSLGCPKNRVDTEHALGSLADLGPILPVQSPEEADCVFINTCGFIAPAVEESVRTLMETLSLLDDIPEKKRPLFVVAGCLVGRYGKETLAPDLPEVDLFLDNKELLSWGRQLKAALDKRKRGSRKGQIESGLSPEVDETGFSVQRLLSTGPSYAWLKISEGCRHQCSFCTIPSIRGPLRSTPADILEREAGLLLEQGVRELVLVAQDLTAWGKDLGVRHGLADLLEKLLPLPGLARLRLMYLYPAGVSKDLLAFLKQAGPPFVPYFDVPLQHAAAGVLSRMGRPFAGKPRESIERIRSVFPEAALRTSIIVGFPGESREDFEELRRFVVETRFHHLGVFTYQPEEGTAAALMPDQLPDDVKEERRGILMQIQSEISSEILEAYVGQRQDILVDAPQGEWPGLHIGRTWFQAPESDGHCYISGPGVLPGAMVNAEIVEASEYDLTALADSDGK